MPTAAVQNVRLVIATANARGVSPSKLLAATGIDPQALLDPDGRIPLEPALRAWQIAAELTGDPWFGLSAAEHMRPDAFGMLGFVMHASATLGEGFRRIGQYFHLLNQRIALELREDGELARVQLRVDHTGAAIDQVRHPIECMLATLLVGARRASGTQLAPAAVAFPHAAPAADRAAYLRVFGVAPAFEQPHAELALPRPALALPHPTPDGGLIALAERHLRRLLDELPRADTHAARVRRVLVEELRHGEPTLARIAERLRTSERTLQRRLGEEGTSLAALLDELRRELALRYLAESRESIAEISFLLGFAEVRAFHRAFKRWTDSTPAAYRQARGPAAGAA